MSTPSSPRGIDPRGPRFGAGVTGILLLVVIALGLVEGTATTFAARAAQPAFILLAVLVLIFAWGAFAGIQRHPYGLFFKAVIRPRLRPPAELEDPVPPTFAQGVGFVITLIGAVLHLAGVPYAVGIFGALAFIAAFLNSVFGYCLGCQMYLLLVRAGILGRSRVTRGNPAT
ncbi:MAG TPA: DUF4395 domain-containing protein [Pseudolysinimonas sp.]|nr:DUF4395 domain-containing protein [Pseudolysinimonas sp.]